MAKSMIDFVIALIGNARGGLSYVMLCAMYLVSGTSRSEGGRHGGDRPDPVACTWKERGVREGEYIALRSPSPPRRRRPFRRASCSSSSARLVMGISIVAAVHRRG